MSGVRTGTRLQQMLALRTKLDQEIAAERRRLALAARPYTNGEVPNRVDVMLAELGVTARDVKVWARTKGLVSQVQRGRVGADLVAQYAITHGRREVTL